MENLNPPSNEQTLLLQAGLQAWFYPRGKGMDLDYSNLSLVISQ